MSVRRINQKQRKIVISYSRQIDNIALEMEVTRVTQVTNPRKEQKWRKIQTVNISH